MSSLGLLSLELERTSNLLVRFPYFADEKNKGL